VARAGTTRMSSADPFLAEHDFPCWCGERAARLFCRQQVGRRFAVLACQRCGTHRILPKAIPSAGAARELYNTAQHTRAALPPATARENVRRILRRMEKVGVPFAAGATVLDVGCSEGLLLETIRERYGCRVVGVDVDESALARARRDFPQVTFLCGLAQDLAGELPPADVVIASAILEHVLDPESFLHQLSQRLRPGGTLFLLTPNAGSFHYRLARSWWRELLAIGEHVYLFTPGSLARLAGAAGLRVQVVGTDYDAVVRPKFAWPRTLKAAAVVPWSYLQVAVKLGCVSLPRRFPGDILFASLGKK